MEFQVARLCKLQKKVHSTRNRKWYGGGSLRVLRLLPPLKLVVMILLKVALNTKKSKSNQPCKQFEFVMNTLVLPIIGLFCVYVK
jgi:hypothetical protein